MEKGFLVENGVDVSTCSSTDTKEEKENLTKDKNTEKVIFFIKVSFNFVNIF